MSDQKCLPINEYNDLKTDSNNWKFLCTKYDINDPSQIVGKVSEYEAKITGMENTNQDNQQTIHELVAELDETQDTVSTLDHKLRNCELDKETLTNQINTQSIRISELETDVKELTLKLAAIPQNENLTPTFSNWLNMTRLVLWNWLRNGQ